MRRKLFTQFNGVWAILIDVWVFSSVWTSVHTLLNAIGFKAIRAFNHYNGIWST